MLLPFPSLLSSLTQLITASIKSPYHSKFQINSHFLDHNDISERQKNNLTYSTYGILIILVFIAFNPVGLARFVSDYLVGVAISVWIYLILIKKRSYISQDKSGKDRIDNRWISKNDARNTKITTKVIGVTLIITLYMAGINNLIGDTTYPIIENLFLTIQPAIQLLLGIVLVTFMINIFMKRNNPGKNGDNSYFFLINFIF